MISEEYRQIDDQSLEIQIQWFLGVYVFMERSALDRSDYLEEEGRLSERDVKQTEHNWWSERFVTGVAGQTELDYKALDWHETDDCNIVWSGQQHRHHCPRCDDVIPHRICEWRAKWNLPISCDTSMTIYYIVRCWWRNVTIRLIRGFWQIFIGLMVVNGICTVNSCGMWFCGAMKGIMKNISESQKSLDSDKNVGHSRFNDTSVEMKT